MNIRFHKALKAVLFFVATIAFVVGALNLSAGVAVAQHSQNNAATTFSSLAAAPTALTTNQIIIKYKSSTPANLYPKRADIMRGLSIKAGVLLNYYRAMSGNTHVLRLPNGMPLAQVKAIAARLMASPDVEYAEPDQIRFPIGDANVILPKRVSSLPLPPPNDEFYAYQWDMFDTWGIDAPDAWNFTTGSTNVVVAVIDTGITNHAEFAGRTVPGYDFISDSQIANDNNGRDSDPSDPGDWITAAENNSGYFMDCGESNSSWHGTHVAGTIGATSNNGLGIAGINWNTKILPVRVLGKCGGYDSDIIDGMMWSAGQIISGVPVNNNPARVLNISLGGYGLCGPDYQDAINSITAAGAVVVVAAGNSTANTSDYAPANCNGIITVAASNRSGDMTYYSNYGTMIEISAPGGEMFFENDPNGILSTWNIGTQGPVADSYHYDQGTSMAAPHVSGVAALLFSINPSLSPAQVLQIIQNTAKSFPSSSYCSMDTSACGSGILDAGAAVAYAESLIVTPTLTQTNTSTKTATATKTPTPTLTQTRTLTKTVTMTKTITTTPTVTKTSTPTITGTLTLTKTITFTPIITTTIMTPTLTRTLTTTPTVTNTITLTRTITNSLTKTMTATITSTQTKTPTLTLTKTPTVTPSPIIVNAVISPVYGTCSSQHWYKIAGAGYGGTDLYLTLNTNMLADSTNSARWTPNLPIPGQYKVEAFAAFHHQITWQCKPNTTIGYDTSDARYNVYLNGTALPYVHIDQKPLNDQWATIGTYSFAAGTGSYVILTDFNGESQLTRTISFNVLRFTYVGP